MNIDTQKHQLKLEQKSGESTSGYDNEMSRPSSPTPSYISEATGVSSIGTTESAYDHVGALLKGSLYKKAEVDVKEEEEESDEEECEVDHVKALLLRGSTARPGVVHEDSDRLDESVVSEDSLPKTYERANPDTSIRFRSSTEDQQDLEDSNQSYIEKYGQSDDLLVALQPPATVEDHYLCKDSDDEEPAGIYSRESMSNIAQAQEQYFKDNNTKEVEDDDIATLDIDDLTHRVSIDKDIQDEMYEDYQKIANKEDSSKEDSVDTQIEIKEEDEYMNKSIFDLDVQEEIVEEINTSPHKITFLDASSSSSYSSADTPKEENKKESTISSYDFNNDLETGGQSIRYDDDTSTSAIHETETIPIKENRQDSTTSRRNKKIAIALCLTLTVTGIILGCVFAFADDEPLPPTQPPTPGNGGDISDLFLETHVEKHGTSSFTDFGKFVATNGDGSTVAIVGTASDRLLQIYTKEVSNEMTSLTEMGYISKTTIVSILDMRLSGNGNYVAVTLDDSRLIVYTKPTSGEKWALAADPITYTQRSASMPVAISNDGTITATGIPNARVEIYKLANGKLSLQGNAIAKPENSSDFGVSLALNSAGDRIAISTQTTVYLYLYNTTDWYKLLTIPIMEQYTTTSLALNDIGDLLCLGAHTGGDTSGQCACYTIQQNNENTTAVQHEILHHTPNEEPSFGTLVELSKNGNILAVTANSTVHAYEKNGTNWLPIEPMTLKEDGDSNFGKSLSLNMDGSLLYVGSPDGEGDYGTVYLYDTKQDTASQ